MRSIIHGIGDKFMGWAEFGAKDAVDLGSVPTGAEQAKQERARKKSRKKASPLSKLKGVKPLKAKKKKHRGNPY